MHWQLLMCASAAGLIAHQGLFIRGEWHLKGPRIILGHLTFGGIAWWFLLRHQSATITEHIYGCLWGFGSYIISLFASILIYRLFFHPLRHFPGPRLAAASKLWHIFKCRECKNFRVLEDMHHQYGQFVRTGEVSSMALGPWPAV